MSLERSTGVQLVSLSSDRFVALVPRDASDEYKISWLARLIAMLALVVASACTAAQLAGWQAALAALGVAAPASCVLVVDAAGAPAGKVCSAVATDASGFAAWLSGVLATLPATVSATKTGPQGAAMGAAMPLVAYDLVGGVHVELRPDLVAPVLAAAKAKAAAAAK